LPVVGLDLGDRYSRYCMLNSTGEMMEEGRIQTTAAAMEKHFGSDPRPRITLEAGTHSPWVSRLLKSYGHQVIVANPRKIPTLSSLHTTAGTGHTICAGWLEVKSA
jgi:transposase